LPSTLYMAHIKLDRYPQVANIIDILFARVSSYLPGVNEQLQKEA